jgi:hypothetical protein
MTLKMLGKPQSRLLLSAGVPGTTRPPATDQTIDVSASGAHGQERLHRTMKRSDPIHRADQVMIHVECPPYHGPRSPVDLVTSEIVFVRWLNPLLLIMIKPCRRGNVGFVRKMSASK